jgi:hypothetical protein
VKVGTAVLESGMASIVCGTAPFAVRVRLATTPRTEALTRGALVVSARASAKRSPAPTWPLPGKERNTSFVGGASTDRPQLCLKCASNVPQAREKHGVQRSLTDHCRKQRESG